LDGLSSIALPLPDISKARFPVIEVATESLCPGEIVKEADPLAEEVTVPGPLRAESACEKELRSKLAPELTVSAVAAGRALLTSLLSVVPASIVVAPLKSFAAPDSSRVPDPETSSDPEPPIDPVKTKGEELLSAAIAASPAKVMGPAQPLPPV
jgi:hypothetical protein